MRRTRKDASLSKLLPFMAEISLLPNEPPASCFAAFGGVDLMFLRLEINRGELG
ncbi:MULTISPECIES: hypothetical protein [unclassified Nostoc]|uniref:hypothetical protein n=1 Tax=unclassified Nostoc TaxID=2593658 RepID=UPI002AD37874|nr:hypothetical protein [Nostoc sp. DedQUE03]MDZ7973705.1 hypothetical protein [Nostoc sp. DedQUE03]MDZ8048188.1 hypothetical protein [Nostoc sp. DedQUE02]